MPEILTLAVTAYGEAYVPTPEIDRSIQSVPMTSKNVFSAYSPFERQRIALLSFEDTSISDDMIYGETTVPEPVISNSTQFPETT